MKSKGLHASLIGGGLAAGLIVAQVVHSAVAWMLPSRSAVHVSVYLYGLMNGLLGAGALIGLIASPWVTWSKKNKRTAMVVVAAVLLPLSTFFMSGFAMLAFVGAVGGALGLSMIDLLPYEAPMGERLAVSIGSLLTFLFGGVFLAVVANGLAPRGGSFVSVQGTLMMQLGALVVSRAVVWVGVRMKKQDALNHQARLAQRGVASAPDQDVAAPPGWLWARLHDRNAGMRAFGYLYRDAQGAPTFDVIADLAAMPTADALWQRQYRGGTSVRLGQHEMLSMDGVPADVAQAQWQRFMQGGSFGVAVLALAQHEAVALRVPQVPPWLRAYAPR